MAFFVMALVVPKVEFIHAREGLFHDSLFYAPLEPVMLLLI